MVKDRRYHILVVIRWPIGGIRTFIRYVYKQFDQSHYHFTFIAPDYHELRLLLDDLKKYHVTYIPLERRPSTIRFFSVVLQTLIKDKFDLLHSHGLTAGICSILPSLISRTPHLLTVHEPLIKQHFRGFKGNFIRFALFLSLPLINVIHSVSCDEKDSILECISSLRIFKRKLVIIPNGIDVEQFSITETRDLRKELNLSKNTFLIGFFGRFMPAKGFVYLVDALDLIYKNYKLSRNPLILSFGGGPFMAGAFIKDMKKYVKEKRLEEAIYFLPFTTNIAPTIRGVDVVVMPSLWEACGLQSMEAMVAGVPVIGTNCIGLRETLSGTPGIIVPPRDSKALADALFKEMIVPSKEIFKEFRKEAYCRFDTRKTAKKLEKVMIGLFD